MCTWTVDVLSGGQPGEHVGIAMAYALGLDVEQRAAVGL